MLIRDGKSYAVRFFFLEATLFVSIKNYTLRFPIFVIAIRKIRRVNSLIN